VKKRMYVSSTFWNQHLQKINFFVCIYWNAVACEDKIRLNNCMFLSSIDNDKLSRNSFIWRIAISCWKMILYKLKRRFCIKLCCPLKCTYKTMSENYAPLIFTRTYRAIMLLKQIKWNNLQFFFMVHTQNFVSFSVFKDLWGMNEWIGGC